MWTYNSLVLQEASVGARPVASSVFDIVKAFNLLCRSIIFALCEHFGFPAQILHAWKSALHSLGRSVLINGWIGGFQVSSTGYPEGDPLSILAMYVMSWSAAFFTMGYAPVLFSCYADNWEIIGDRPCHVAKAVELLQQFAGAVRLSFAPEKCWSWAYGSDARKQVAAITWLGTPIPCKHDAVNLGVQTLYTRRKKVALRNKRFLEGKRRCCRIKKLPTGRRFRARLVKQGVWTQALHGAEIMKLGKTVFADLRTAMAAAVKAPQGASPWLVGAATTLGCLDPEFQVAINRVLNYRNFCRHVPMFADRFVHSLTIPNPKMSGAGSLLRADLLKLGFVHCFRDSFQWQGVKLHLSTSTSKHVRRIIELAWGCHIAPKIVHRKSLQDLQSIWIQSASVHASLTQEELAYLFAVQVGASFTADFYRHWSPDDRCKLCGQFFTDASACFPQRPWWRLAAAAVIQVPHFDNSAQFGDWELFWKGALPTSNQNVVRAEMLAGYVAFAAASKVSVYSDCKVFVDGAQAILDHLHRGAPCPTFRQNVDLWCMIYGAAKGLSPGSFVHWVKGHVNWRTCAGTSQWQAFYNDIVDAAAKKALHEWREAFHPHRTFVDDAGRCVRSYTLLVKYHLQVAKHVSNADPVDTSTAEPVRQNWNYLSLRGLPPWTTFQTPGLELRCPRLMIDYVHMLAAWCTSLKWVPHTSVPSLSDTSWIEVFWHATFDMKCRPPLLVNKLWCHESRNPEVRLIPRNTLADFRCFKRHLFALDKLVGPVMPCWRLTSCASPRTFGCPIKLAGINMRISRDCTGSMLDFISAVQGARNIHFMPVPTLHV